MAETVADPSLPLAVGIGLDAGEAVRVDGGYRGGALNLAARLCSLAGPGEVLVSPEVAHLARKVEGLDYVERGGVRLKGLEKPVEWSQFGPSARTSPRSRVPACARSRGRRDPRDAQPVQRPARVRRGRRGGLLRPGDADGASVERLAADALPRGRRPERQRQVVGRARRPGAGAAARRPARLRALVRRRDVPRRAPARGAGSGAAARRRRPAGSLLEQLEQDERGLLRAVKRVCLVDDESKLVLVDRPVRGAVHAGRGRGGARPLPRQPVAAVTDPRSRLRVDRHAAGRFLRPAAALPRLRRADARAHRGRASR